MTNKRATNNPDRTLKFFTVFTRPFFAKKNAQQHYLSAHWTPSSSEFFAAQLRAARPFFSAARPRLSNKYFRRVPR